MVTSVSQKGLRMLPQFNTPMGYIISIYMNDEPIARLRQIGKTHSDVRLEWLTWNQGKATEHAAQFPMCSLADVDDQSIQRMYDKYLKVKP
jgi:hypothetical protein